MFHNFLIPRKQNYQNYLTKKINQKINYKIIMIARKAAKYSEIL